MPLKADYKPRFKKELRGLPAKDQAEIKNGIESFVNKTGEKFDVLRLKDNLWRLKVGVWRVFFTFEGDLLTFTNVKRRTSKTYKK
jgi:mRNA-degrading endonuclease RelE of RelBE toxin-antitoxin system